MAELSSRFWAGKLLSWHDINPITLKKRHLALFDSDLRSPKGEKLHLWNYRRILCKDNFIQGTFASDISLVNWPQMDYWLGPLLGVSPEAQQAHLKAAKELSLALLYWMQHEAPRHDSQNNKKQSSHKQGYPELRLRADVFETQDGLAKAPYIRESRRILPLFRVTEAHLGVEQRGQLKGAELFEDSVGIGSYRIDLHPSTALKSYLDISSYPFQIPLGALIPQRMENLLPAAKNIGVTHITNGCYRLHPVEWNIGEVAGALAAYCLKHHKLPREIYQKKSLLRHFQEMLVRDFDIELSWPDYARFYPC
ncbi:MAG: FAD-dependent oxidoreductase [Deinococcales bacterium]